jgi:hypothetical protein
MSIHARYLEKQANDFYLRSTTYLMQIGNKEFREELTRLYNTGDIQMMTVATILNAIYTDGKPTFYLSMRSLSELLESDKNLSYKGRRGIAPGEYREAYSLVVDYFDKEPEFDLHYRSSQQMKTPMCVSLVDEIILRSMGDQMMIKLASNWHQTVIKNRQALDTIEQSENSIHDTVTDTSTGTMGRDRETSLKENPPSPPKTNSVKVAGFAPPQPPKVNGAIQTNSIESIFGSWSAALPAMVSKGRDAYFYTLFSDLATAGYSPSDITRSMKDQIVYRTMPRSKPPKMSKEKYDAWTEMTLRDYDDQLAKAFYQPTVLKQPVMIESESEEDQQEARDLEWVLKKTRQQIEQHKRNEELCSN